MRYQNLIKFYRPNWVSVSVVIIYGFSLLLWGIAPLATGLTSCCTDIGVLQNPFYLQPYISIQLAEAAKQFGGLWVEVLIARFFLPLCTLVLLITIFRRQLSSLWSVTLALLAISAIGGYPFRSYLIQIFLGQWEALGSGLLPELLYFPIPSFSTTYFLLIFFFATRSLNILSKTLFESIFTIFFSLIAYINPIDLIFAFAFWGVYLPILWVRRRMNAKSFFYNFCFQVLLAFVLVIPAFYMGKINLSLPHHASFNWYYAILYLFLPIVLTVLLFVVQRIDPYEIVIKFRHVYAILFAEIFVYTLSIWGIVPLNQEIFQMRILQFFAHAYYYVPVIYYASRSSFIGSYGIESVRVSKFLRKSLGLLFKQLAPFYLVLTITLLFGYNFSSGFRYFQGLDRSNHYFIEKR